MNLESKSLPVFYLDTLPDILNADRKELLRFIEIQADESHIFAWLNQLRVAPYSYDLVDNRCRKSPHYIIKNLPPIRINTHFLLAFHIQAFKENSFLVGRFCEPINTPLDSYINGLYIEYRLIRKEKKTELWCKVLGFVKEILIQECFSICFQLLIKL